MKLWILRLDERVQAVLIGMITTGFSYGMWWLMSKYFRELNGPMFTTPALLFPAFAFISWLSRRKFPSSVRMVVPTMIKYNIASYFLGIVGAVLMFTISGFVVSTIGASLGLYGFMILGRALQLAKDEEQG
ncbi:MAG: hypothetical protein WCI55_05495 [Armatimonadota bacterium]